MMPICKISFRFLEKLIHESRKSENIIKVGKYEKNRGIFVTGLFSPSSNDLGG